VWLIMKMSDGNLVNIVLDGEPEDIRLIGDAIASLQGVSRDIPAEVEEVFTSVVRLENYPQYLFDVYAYLGRAIVQYETDHAGALAGVPISCPHTILAITHRMGFEVDESGLVEAIPYSKGIEQRPFYELVFKGVLFSFLNSSFWKRPDDTVFAGAARKLVPEIIMAGIPLDEKLATPAYLRDLSERLSGDVYSPDLVGSIRNILLGTSH
jgi:hypothetical protein